MALLFDRYGLPVSTASTVARDAYVSGVDCLLSAAAGGREHFERALAADAHFALAHVALARSHLLVGDVPRARVAAAAARERAVSSTAREQGHVDALALAIEGKSADALAATRAHVARYPRDALAIAPATGVFGLIGFSGRRAREKELAEFLDALAPHYGDDWWFLAVRAFAACEYGRLTAAWDLIERSMAGNPRNAHGAHIRAHVLYEMGEPQRGLDYLESWMPDYAKAGLMHCHLSWHVALWALELGRVDRAWQVYRDDVHPGGAWGPPLNVVTDSVSFLWRAALSGGPRRPELWREVRDHAADRFPEAGMAFVDVHRAVAAAADGDSEALAGLVAALRDRVADQRQPAGPVVPLLAEAFGAFGVGQWDRAIALFEEAQDETVRIGGSRAQRDLTLFTLLAAYLKAGRPDEAKRAIERRGDRRATVNVAGYS